MSGGSPGQNTALLTIIVVVVVMVVVGLLVGRVRRARAAGTVETGSVRSRGQAKEIADRLDGVRRRGAGDGPTTPVRVRVRGAARLMAVLRADDRFDVADRGAGDEYWSFAVAVGDGADHGEVQRGMTDVLARNGVTATAD